MSIRTTARTSRPRRELRAAAVLLLLVQGMLMEGLVAVGLVVLLVFLLPAGILDGVLSGTALVLLLARAPRA